MAWRVAALPSSEPRVCGWLKIVGKEVSRGAEGGVESV
jgi:hypothetical protein